MINVTENTLIDIDRSIGDIETKRSKLLLRKRECETQMAQYKSRIRSSKLRLPPKEYKDVCRKQDELRKEIHDTEKGIVEADGEIRKRYVLKDEVRLQLKQNGTLGEPMKERLIKIRDHYLQFSGDNTRVSSMRIMASQFAEEIEALIKTL